MKTFDERYGDSIHLGFATMRTYRKWWQFWKPTYTEEKIEVAMVRTFNIAKEDFNKGTAQLSD